MKNLQTNLHTEVLTEQCKVHFKKLKNFKKDFYLAGGTALALQIGHRISVDLDFFSGTHIKKTFLEKVREIFKGSIFQVEFDLSKELTLSIDNVKYTFLHYPFPLVNPLIETDELNFLGVKEILATKAYSVGRRGSAKDYIDLYFSIKEEHATLQEIIDLAKKKYEGLFNGVLFCEQLLYMEDIEIINIDLINRELPTKAEIITFFEERIKELI